MKKTLVLAFVATLVAGSVAVAPASAYTDSSLGANKIGRIGASSRTAYKGNEIDLEVRKGVNVKERNIYWSIEDTSVVRFDDDERYDDEIELRAVGKGTTKVVAKNLITGGKITYKITVKSPTYKISRVGNKERSMKVGNELELRVKRNGGVSEHDLSWSTSNSKVVKIVDGRYDDEVELRAVGTGTAKVSCKNELTGGKIYYTIKVSKASNKISRVGSATRNVEVGDDVELNVKKSGLSNSDIKWTIVDTSILRFEDGDNVGSEVEVSGKRAGTTKVYAKNLVTGGKIYFTITVLPDYDDDWDDDDWDDDEWDD